MQMKLNRRTRSRRPASPTGRPFDGTMLSSTHLLQRARPFEQLVEYHFSTRVNQFVRLEILSLSMNCITFGIGTPSGGVTSLSVVA